MTVAHPSDAHSRRSRRSRHDDGGEFASPLDAGVARPRSPIVVGGLGAGVLHAIVVAGLMLQGPRTVRDRAARPQTAIEAELIREPPPEPKPKVEPPPVPPPPPPPTPKPVRQARAATQAAPAAATAAQLLAKLEPEIVDFGQTFVQGQAQTFTGGVTQAGGTAQHAVREVAARADGAPGGKGTAAVDRSREPSLADGTRWECPFPEEADDEGLDHGAAALRVTVTASGGVERVSVESESGRGFGREARRCALQKRWQAGRDREGKPIGATRLLNVKFDR